MKSAFLILILVGLAGLTLFFSESIVELLAPPPVEQEPGVSLGRITSVTGTVEHRPRGLVVFSPTTAQQSIGNFMTLRTGPESSAEMALYNRYVLKLEANSEIILEELSSSLRQVVITLRRGDFRVLNEGDANTLLTVHRDLVAVPVQHQPKPLVVEVPKRATPTPAPPPNPVATLPAPMVPRIQSARQLPDKQAVEAEATRTLSDAYINNVISSQNPFFYRCYASLLQRQPDAAGELKFAFQITASGKVTNLQLLEGTLKDENLITCTRSILHRLRFRSYDGQTISVTYPIVFK